MAPRKRTPARARSRRAPEPKPEEARGIVVTMGDLRQLPVVIREHLLKELLTLQSVEQRVDRPAGEASILRNAVTVETRGRGLIGRTERLLDELNESLNTIEHGVRTLGGSWPWPDPPSPKGAGEIADADNFQGMLELRLDRLQGIVRHAGLVAERLRDIA